MNLIEKLLGGVTFSKGPFKNVRIRGANKRREKPRSDLYPPRPTPPKEDAEEKGPPKGKRSFAEAISMNKYLRERGRVDDKPTMDESARKRSEDRRLRKKREAREYLSTSGMHGKFNKYLIGAGDENKSSYELKSEKPDWLKKSEKAMADEKKKPKKAEKPKDDRFQLKQQPLGTGLMRWRRK